MQTNEQKVFIDEYGDVTKDWDGHYVSTNNYGPIPVASSTLLGK